MPAQWTGELVGKMHNAGVTAKQLAAEMGKNPKYVSQVLNAHTQHQPEPTPPADARLPAAAGYCGAAHQPLF